MLKTVLLMLALGWTCAGQARMTAPPIPSALPNVDSISQANAVGVLNYCMSKGLVSTTSATIAVGELGKASNVTTSADYTAGAAGEIRGSKRFSIPAAPRHLQSRACDMVLRQANKSR